MTRTLFALFGAIGHTSYIDLNQVVAPYKILGNGDLGSPKVVRDNLKNGFGHMHYIMACQKKLYFVIMPKQQMRWGNSANASGAAIDKYRGVIWYNLLYSMTKDTDATHAPSITTGLTVTVYLDELLEYVKCESKLFDDDKLPIIPLANCYAKSVLRARHSPGGKKESFGCHVGNTSL